MPIQRLGPVDNLLHAAVAHKRLAHPLGRVLVGPKDARKLLHHVKLRLENAQQQVQLVTYVLDLVDQRNVAVDLLVQRAFALPERVAEFLEEDGFLV